MKLRTPNIQYSDDLELEEFYLTQMRMMLKHFQRIHGCMPKYVEILTDYEGCTARAFYKMENYRISEDHLSCKCVQPCKCKK